MTTMTSNGSERSETANGKTDCVSRKDLLSFVSNAFVAPYTLVVWFKVLVVSYTSHWIMQHAIVEYHIV